MYWEGLHTDTSHVDAGMSNDLVTTLNSKEKIYLKIFALIQLIKVRNYVVLQISIRRKRESFGDSLFIIAITYQLSTKRTTQFVSEIEKVGARTA